MSLTVVNCSEIREKYKAHLKVIKNEK